MTMQAAVVVLFGMFLCPVSAVMWQLPVPEQGPAVILPQHMPTDANESSQCVCETAEPVTPTIWSLPSLPVGPLPIVASVLPMDFWPEIPQSNRARTSTTSTTTTVRTGPPVDQQTVKDAVANVAIGSDSRAKAVRALRDMHKADPSIAVDAENIKLYVALCQLRGGSSWRITPSMLKTWRTEAISSAAVKISYYVVQKTTSPNLDGDASVKKFLVDASSIEDMPAGVDPSSVWIVDKGCDRKLLGRGVYEIEFKVGVRKSFAHPGSDATAPAIGDVCGHVDTASEGMLPVRAAETEYGLHAVRLEQGAGAGKQASRRERLLQPRLSETDPDELSEKIAVETKKAFDLGRLFSTDMHDPTSAEFWLRQYRDYAKSLPAASTGLDVESLPAHVQQYVRFVVKMLLQTGPSYHHLKVFAQLLTEIQATCASLVPSLGQAVIKLAHFPLLGDGSLDVDDLTMQQRHTFYSSALYKKFMDCRREAQFLHAKRSDLETAERVQLCQKLLGQAPPEEMKAELQFALTVLGGASDAVKLTFLLARSERFDLLAQWMPQEKAWIRFKPFSTPSDDIKYMPVDDYFAGSHDLLESDVDLTAIQQPVAQSLLRDYKSMLSMTTDCGLPMLQLVEGVFHELSVVKLGLEGYTSPEPTKVEGCVDKAKQVLAIASARYKKISKDAKMKSLIYLVEIATSAQTSSIDASGTEVASAPEAGALSSSAGSSAIDSRAEGVVGSTASEETTAVTEDDGNDLLQKEVITTAAKLKGQYDNKRARVIKVLAGGRKMRVELLEGPSKGETRDYMKGNVRLVGASDESSCAVPAGKRSPEGAAEHTGPPSKAQKSDGKKLAAELFGNMNDMD